MSLIIPYTNEEFLSLLEKANKGSTGIGRNLLDNAYFGNPVNQRGQTEYTGGGYTIDRWQSNRSVIVVDSANGLSVKWDGVNNTNGWVREILEPELSRYLLGKTVTVSALTSDGFLYSATGVVAEKSGTFANTDYVINGNSVRVAAEWGTSMDTMDVIFTSQSTKDTWLLAAKLELGTEQTLAHQDADGNWVLNEIPDKRIELLKCSMATDPSDPYANKMVQFV